MLDVPVAEVVLQRPRVVAIVRELEAAGVAKQVRVQQGCTQKPCRRSA